MNWNKEKYKELKECYDFAVREEKETFVFEGKVLLTSFAKYLLEHLKSELNVE